MCLLRYVDQRIYLTGVSLPSKPFPALLSYFKFMSNTWHTFLRLWKEIYNITKCLYHTDPWNVLLGYNIKYKTF